MRIPELETLSRVMAIFADGLTVSAAIIAFVAKMVGWW